MAEYIERKRAIVDACNSLELYPSEYAKLEDALNKIPAADVAPVRRGRWIVLDDCANEGLYCSECKKRIYKKVPKVMPNFCSNCGTKMHLEEEPEFDV